MQREIVIIDEELCDGCGLCVPACHEGALKIIDGKARLIADRLCDGLGDCLGECPQGAIKVERRPAEAFDKDAVQVHLQAGGGAADQPTAAACPTDTAKPSAPAGGSQFAGCPGSKFAAFSKKATGETPMLPMPDRTGCPGAAGVANDQVNEASALTHWPVQLHLLPPTAPVLRGAQLLVAADCVPVAYADFQSKLLHGRAIVIACPKLDDTSGYVEKLAAMIRENDLKDITVARMEVPCCAGILNAVLEARRLADSDVPVEDVVIGVQGRLVTKRPMPVAPVNE